MTYPESLYSKLALDKKRIEDIKSGRRKLGTNDHSLDHLEPLFKVIGSEGQESTLKYQTFLAEITPRELKYIIGFEKPEEVSMSSQDSLESLHVSLPPAFIKLLTDDSG